MAYDLIQVGTGGQGEMWCREFLPPNVEAGRVDVVAAVDVDEDAHVNAQEGLDVSPEDCYTDAEAAFADHPEADCCAIVVPPWIHEEIVDLAVEHDCHVISEKPIADTLAASVRIAEKIERAGLKMGVTMTHRFDRDKTTLREEIRADRSGPLDYLVGRFTCNARSYGDWGAFRHDIEDPLLVEGAVHQLDFLADMAGAPVETLYADTWQPDWAEYDGDCQALVQMRCENGVRVAWEGAKANAVGLNGWGSDYVRAECRDATLVLDDREIVRHPYDPDSSLVVGATDERDGEPVELLERETWGNTLLIERFVEWLEGGEPMVTNVQDNLQSVALIEAAMQSSETGEPVNVQALLAETRESVGG
jgi:predicted dehydrogenase